MTNLLIEIDELASRLDEPSLRIFDASVYLRPAENGYRAESGLETYSQRHIQGAAFLDLIQDLSDTTTGLGFSLPDSASLANAIGEAGIGNDHNVVLYSSGHMMWATRAWWLLHHIGHKNVRVLNASIDQWIEAGHPVEEGQQSYAPTTFDPAPRADVFVDLEGMQTAEGLACTVNALTREMYTGEGDFHYGRRGHIPGSLHLHFDELMDDDRFRPVDELKAVLGNQGLLEKERLITYCGGGIAATVNAFACKLCGHDNIAVYDGSMSEWVGAGMPLTEGSAP